MNHVMDNCSKEEYNQMLHDDLIVNMRWLDQFLVQSNIRVQKLISSSVEFKSFYLDYLQGSPPDSNNGMVALEAPTDGDGGGDNHKSYKYSIFRTPDSSETSRSSSISNAPATVVKSARRNFVSGEISVYSMCSVIACILHQERCKSIWGESSLSKNTSSSDTLIASTEPVWRINFIDLGCGCGIPLACSLLSLPHFQFMFGKSVTKSPQFQSKLSLVGVDMMKSKLIEAKCLLVSMLVNTVEAQTLSTQSCPDERKLERGSSFQELDVDISLIQGNFLEPSIVDQWTASVIDTNRNIETSTNCNISPMSVNIVYICATCYDTATVNGIYVAVLEKMHIGSKIIILDKEFKFTTINEHEKPGCATFAANAFTLLNSCQVAVSWGSANAYIYEKIV